MTARTRPRLTIPTLIASSLLLACAADDGEGSATSSSTTSTSTTSSSTTSTSTTSTDATTGTTGDESSTGTGTGIDPTTGADVTSTTTETTSDTGEMPDCQALQNERECNAEPLCFWETFGACFDDCEALPDMESCFEGVGCNWIDGSCMGPF